MRSINLVSIDIDAFDAFQSCSQVGCSDYASFRVLLDGKSAGRMCWTHAKALEAEVKSPRCTCTHSLLRHQGEHGALTHCADCACERFIHADAEGKPLWLADGGWYD